MADPVVIEQPVPAVPAVPVASPTPVTAAPDTVVSPQPDPAVAAPSAPVVESSSPTTGADTKPAEADKPEPTLLEKFDLEKTKPAEEKKADEAKPATEAKPGEAEKPAEAKPELPKVDYFAAEGGLKLPETITMTDEQRGQFATALDAFRGDPTPAGAQSILDMGTKMMTDYAEHLGREQIRVWNETRNNWRTQVAADPWIGGARHQTAMHDISDVRNVLVPQADRDAFNEFLHVTGAGDHPAFLRMLHRGARFFKEAGPPPPDPKPAPDNGKRPGKRGPADIYTNTQFK